MAPLKAPFSWPKSMSSINCSGKAPQFRLTNGPRTRGEASCSTRASTSFPAPVGPTSNALTSVVATFCAKASNCWLAGSTKTTLRGGCAVAMATALRLLATTFHAVVLHS